MPQYYVNKRAQANGDHEVHASTCSFLPDAEHRHYLGGFPDCRPAVARAQKLFPPANGCYFCARECHTS